MGLGCERQIENFNFFERVPDRRSYSRQVAQQVEKEIGITLRRSVTAVPRPAIC